MVSKWAIATGLAQEYRRLAREMPAFRATHTYQAMVPFIDAIEDVTTAPLPWRARWQVLLTGKLPEEL